jgi:hypothetical protein
MKDYSIELEIYERVAGQLTQMDRTLTLRKKGFVPGCTGD